jgi:hypothetical protein
MLFVDFFLILGLFCVSYRAFRQTFAIILHVAYVVVAVCVLKIFKILVKFTTAGIIISIVSAGIGS